jgi:hypothetical protein
MECVTTSEQEFDSMTTKSLNLTYWITTSTFCLIMAASGVLYLTSIGFKERFAHLAFPSYFRVELAVFILAGIVVFAPLEWPSVATKAAIILM